MPSVLTFKAMKGVELFSIGKWNGRVFTKEDLKGVVDAYDYFSNIIDIPLKLGHNDEQPLTDGQPAIKWLESVRLSDNGEVIIGDFVDMPDIVYDAINKRLYDNISVEMDVNVVHMSKKFPYALTAVALLGADLPAVNTLSSLKEYIGKGKSDAKLTASRKILFTSTKEDGRMTIEEMQAQLALIQGKVAALEKDNADLVTRNATLSTQVATFSAEKQRAEEENKKMAFSKAKGEVVDTMEILVKSGRITPAQRDTFSRQIVEGDIDSVTRLSSTIDVLALGMDKIHFSKDTKMQSKNNGGSELPPDRELVRRISELRSSREGAHLSFSAARDRVMKANPELASDYIALTPEV